MQVIYADSAETCLLDLTPASFVFLYAGSKVTTLSAVVVEGSNVGSGSINCDHIGEKVSSSGKRIAAGTLWAPARQIADDAAVGLQFFDRRVFRYAAIDRSMVEDAGVEVDILEVI
jgi:hypothetical protein